MPTDLPITDTLTISGTLLREEAMRSGGPGGQHQNTTDSAVRLRFDLAGCEVLHPAVKRRLAAAFPSQVTDAGELLVVARGDRSQHRNREDARARLAAMIVAHLAPPKPRRPTRPTRGSVDRRIATKKARGAVKALRGKTED